MVDSISKLFILLYRKWKERQEYTYSFKVDDVIIQLLGISVRLPYPSCRSPSWHREAAACWWACRPSSPDSAPRCSRPGTSSAGPWCSPCAGPPASPPGGSNKGDQCRRGLGQYKTTAIRSVQCCSGLGQYKTKATRSVQCHRGLGQYMAIRADQCRSGLGQYKTMSIRSVQCCSGLGH